MLKVTQKEEKELVKIPWVGRMATLFSSAAWQKLASKNKERRMGTQMERVFIAKGER